MIHIACAVLDAAVGSYNRPFFVPSTALAVRSFSDEVNRNGDGNNSMAAHPADFSLWRLGLFDDETGKFESEPVPVLLIKAVDVFSGSV